MHDGGGRPPGAKQATDDIINISPLVVPADTWLGTLQKNKIHYHQCTGGGLRKGGYVQPDHGSVPPLPWFLLAERFDQRGRSSPAPLALCARWDSNHGLSPWNHTPHCQLITVPVRLTNYVGRADKSQLSSSVSCDRAATSSTGSLPAATAFIASTPLFALNLRLYALLRYPARSAKFFAIFANLAN